MNARRMLSLYPRSYRERYGAELVDLTEDLVAGGEISARRATLNLAAGALAQRWLAVVGSRHAIVVMTGLSVVAAIAGAAFGIRAQVAHHVTPYFFGRAIGGGLLVVVGLWYLLEVLEMLQVRQRREGAIRPRQGSLVAIQSLSGVAGVTLLYTAPALFTGASFGSGPVDFGIGAALVVAGVVLRVACFWALGEYFTIRIQVSPDQPVIDRGPYKWLRHPSYAGMLLIAVGAGVLFGNWVGLLGLVVPLLLVQVWQIRVEETALVATLGQRYRMYARQHKRLIPLVW